MNKINEILPRLNEEGIFFDWVTFARRKVVENLSLTAPNDLYISVFGKEKWPADREPMTRKEGMNTFGFVFSGKGYIIRGDERYEITKNSYFLFPFEQNITFGTDTDDPWEYLYFDIGGINQNWVLDAAGFGEKLVMHDDAGEIKRLATELYRSALENGRCAFKTTGLLYMLADAMARNHRSQKSLDVNAYVLQAMNYIGNNYEKINAGEIADHCGISVTYLNKLFRREMKMSPIEFVTYYRAMVAQSYLTWSELPLREIAKKSGYNSDKYFIKVFRSVYGVTPDRFRKDAREKGEK